MTTAVSAEERVESAFDTPPLRGWLNGAIAGLLVLDALVTLVLEVLFLPIYAGQSKLSEPQQVLAAATRLASSVTDGAVPLPVTALVAAVVNVALVAGMAVVSKRISVMVLPLTAWTLGFLLLASSGPGGDMMLMSDWPTLLLFVCGLFPAGLYLYWRATSGFGSPAR
ncbi:hypothetical protein [Nocardia inohanensis]|uniref:hypothetical protein n=1 Tax=Nocardia inohanensis TaxID=209246 RepID=UPI0008305958|nr:hypothetical protein [Nocardia inohanensis]